MPSRRLPAALLALAWAATAAGQGSSDEEDLALAYGDKSFVTIATGTQVPVALAPAVASVITAEDIQAMGATDLDQVLETVPGLHVARSTQANMPVYVIRGVHRDANPQVLMLVNGIPVTTAFQRNRGNVWGGLPLENVARIEVIRGPGSALYGADAFTGVISITTKSATDIAGTQVGVRAGSFASRDAWTLHGGRLGSVDVAAYLRVGRTDGANGTITADGQTGLDALLGTRASLAPGPMNNGRDSLDGSLDLAYQDWRLRVGYKQRDHVGSGSGVASALDPTGDSYSERTTSDLTYRSGHLARDWDVTLQASYMRYKEFSDLVLFPAGANLGGGVFTDGMIGNPDKWERHARFSASAIYTGLDQHRLHVGLGVAREEIDRIRETKNFLPGVVPFTPIGTGSLADVTDVSDSAPFLQPHRRQVRFLFAQDEWHFARDWRLTAGLRHDRYSDFGGTTNPRLALAWEAAYNLTAKVLYGSAFRTPSFVELYNLNNPVQVGTPTLVPEKMKTVEGAVSWQPFPALNLGLNVFRYRIRDIIQLVDTVFQNTGSQTGKGLELEATWDATRVLRLAAGYSQQRSIDQATRQDAGLAPHQRIHLRTDWRFTPGWAFDAQVNGVGERQRAPGDTRGPLAGYATLDLALRTTTGPKGWDLSASVRNLFDADAREPSPFGMPFISIPNDFPLPGRSLCVEARYGL